MRRVFRELWMTVWTALTALAARRRARASERDPGRQVYREQTGRIGVRMTETARSRMRGNWFRVLR